MTRSYPFISCALFIAMAGQSASVSAAEVSAALSFSQWSSTFAERSTLFTSGAFTTWQGGVVAWDGASAGTTNVTLTPGIDPFVATSSTGVQYSIPRPHVVDLPAQSTLVSFDDRVGWQYEAFRYDAFPSTIGNLNSISFSAAPASNVVIGQPFLLGTFTVRNGSWHSALNGAPDPVLISFSITSQSPDPAYNGFTFNGTFAYSTYAVAGGTELENADAFWIVERPELGAARIIENQTGTFDLYGSIGSLHLNSFSNATGGVILTPTVGAIPEPNSTAMFALALSLAAFAGARRTYRAGPRTLGSERDHDAGHRKQG